MAMVQAFALHIFDKQLQSYQNHGDFCIRKRYQFHLFVMPWWDFFVSIDVTPATDVGTLLQFTTSEVEAFSGMSAWSFEGTWSAMWCMIGAWFHDICFAVFLHIQVQDLKCAKSSLHALIKNIYKCTVYLLHARQNYDATLGKIWKTNWLCRFTLMMVPSSVSRRCRV